MVPLIYLVRRLVDQRPFITLGLTSLRAGRNGWPWHGVLACPGSDRRGRGVAVGWGADFLSTAGAGTVLLAVHLPLLVFLFEALPEELVFRGYFYRNLAERYAR